MKELEKQLKHLFNPSVPKSLIDSMKPFRDIQERNKLLLGGLDHLKPLRELEERNKLIFGALDSNINSIIKNALEPYNSILKTSIFSTPKIELPAINALKSLSKGFAFNYADTFLKRNNELSKLVQSTLLESLNTKSLLGSHFEEIQKMSRLSGIGVTASLKMFDETLFKNVSSIINQFHADPEFFNELLQEVKDEKINAYSLRSIFEYLSVKAPELLSLDKAVYFLIGMIIQIHLHQFWKEYVVGPNICIARSGCRIRVDGTTDSDIITAVPNGEEILVLEDHGHWKKVFWKKDTGEVYEGWMSASLMQWKYKKIAEDEFINESSGK